MMTPRKRAEVPSRGELSHLVTLLSRYMGLDGTPLQKQQHAYDRYMAELVRLEERYPRVSFRNEGAQAELVRRAHARLREKVVRGPGATY